MSWGYTQDNGPHRWIEIAPAARGLHQSPVNIETGKTDQVAFKPLVIKYVPANSKHLVNNGHTVQVTIDGAGSVLEGGPFPHTYQAAQFHFHWGKTNSVGSEHQVDGKTYAAEMHIVHWNCELYKTIDEAVKSANGLAVLTIFLEVGNEHAELKKLTSLLPKVQFKGSQTDIIGGFDPMSLIPEYRSYWTYSGSLTTPPCHESARFLIFKKTMQVSEEQLNAFRNLRSHTKEAGLCDEFGGRILQNFRPTNPLYDRKIVSSF